MSVIFNRIERSLNLSLNLDQELATQLAELKPEVVIEHAQINIEYAILCSKMTFEWARRDTPAFKAQVKHAQKAAELLTLLYTKYLDLPHEVYRLRKEHRLMTAWLRETSDQLQNDAEPDELHSRICNLTGLVNLPRLFSQRTRRLLMAIVPLVDTTSAYREVMQAADAYMGPFFSHLSWLFFIPRIASHLTLILKHTIEHEGMSKEEKALGAGNRLKIQLLARWPDLANDIPWLIANCVSCFVLLGPLLPYNIILSISMQIYEIAQAVLQYVIEYRHLQSQRAHYLSARDAHEKDTESYEQFNAYLIHLDKRITYESNRLIIPIANTTVLLLAIILAAPVFAPGFAIAGGAIAVSSTIFSLLARKYVESEKPPNDLVKLLENDLRPS